MVKILIVLTACLFLTGCMDTNDGTNESITQKQTEEETITEAVAEPGDTLRIHWTEKSVVIPELQKNYEVWFFSDSHITKVEDTEAEEIRTYATGRMPVFANVMGRDSSEIFKEFIKEANEQKPDIVLYGGDILDFPSEANLAFLKEELGKLTVPYLFAMGNHDWTYPWEYMTPEGVQKYRPLLEEAISLNSYVHTVEWEDIVFLTLDNSSNQVAEEAVEEIERVYALDKPIVLVQHVPFSTKKLIAHTKKVWKNPVTLGMQVHGGIAPNKASSDLYTKVADTESRIRVVLAGHIHLAYEEQLSKGTVEIIADAAFKGNAVKLYLSKE